MKKIISGYFLGSIEASFSGSIANESMQRSLSKSVFPSIILKDSIQLIDSSMMRRIKGVITNVGSDTTHFVIQLNELDIPCVRVNYFNSLLTSKHIYVESLGDRKAVIYEGESEINEKHPFQSKTFNINWDIVNENLKGKGNELT